MSITTPTSNSNNNNNNNNNNSSDASELTLEIPVWVHGKRKWVTGITKKTTFDDLIYALLAQAGLLNTSGIINSSSINITGYAIAECTQLTASSPSKTNDCDPPSLVTQRIIKGRTKVIKAYKAWQFDKLPLTILHLISTASLNDNNPSTSKLRSKLFRRFLSSKSPTISPLPPSISSSQSDSSLTTITSNQVQNHLVYRQKSLNDIHENMNIIERQKRLLDHLDEKIHKTEEFISPTSNTLPKSSSRNSFTQDSLPILNTEVTLNDVSRLFSQPIEQQEQLVFATQLCNSILNIQDRIDEKTSILYAVEQAISNELNQVLHQQHYDTLPSALSSPNTNETNSSLSNDLITLKNSIYRSRELSRIQSKEMHDFDLSLREFEILLASKYDELKYLEYETSSSFIPTSRSITPNYLTQQNFRINIDEQTTFDNAVDIATTATNVLFTSIKEADEDSGINSLTSDDNNNNNNNNNTHSISVMHQKVHTQNSQLETLV